jgi:hypothetical protein
VEVVAEVEDIIQDPLPKQLAVAAEAVMEQLQVLQALLVKLILAEVAVVVAQIQDQHLMLLMGALEL